MIEQVFNLISHTSKKSGGHCGASVVMIASKLDESVEDVQDAINILLAEERIVERKGMNSLIYLLPKMKRK